MIEEFRDIPGYEGIYQVSNFGRVKSLSRYYWNGRCNAIKKEIILISCKDKNGYLIVILCKNTIHKTISVHRLVGICFISNPENKPEINHIDGNKQNNNINNLEWVLHSENQKHRFEILKQEGYWINKNGKDNHTSKLIYQYDLKNNKINEYWGALEAQRNTGINYSCINECCNGKQKTAGKFIWKYANKKESEI